MPARCAHDWRPIADGTRSRCVKCKRERAVGTPETTRNRPCVCEHGCGSKLRVSRSQLARGLYVCPCGGRMVPTTLEDAEHLRSLGVLSDADLAGHPEALAFTRAASSIAHGQAWAGGLQREMRSAAPDVQAWERIYRERTAQAAQNRLAALKAHAYGADAQPDPMPF